MSVLYGVACSQVKCLQRIFRSDGHRDVLTAGIWIPLGISLRSFLAEGFGRFALVSIETVIVAPSESFRRSLLTLHAGFCGFI